MAGGLQNEPTGSSQVFVTRQRFERDVIRGNVPPWYLITENLSDIDGNGFKDFDLPYNAGRCRVSWNTNQWNFEWS